MMHDVSGVKNLLHGSASSPVVHVFMNIIEIKMMSSSGNDAELEK